MLSKVSNKTLLFPASEHKTRIPIYSFSIDKKIAFVVWQVRLMTPKHTFVLVNNSRCKDLNAHFAPWVALILHSKILSDKIEKWSHSGRKLEHENNNFTFS